MKPSTFLLITALTTSGALSAVAQTLPGAPEDNGLTPTTATAYVNGTNLYAINNFGMESLSLDMARNGNVIIGWEDDGDGLNDIESVWTLLDSLGNMITPPTVVSNRSVLGALGTLEVTTNIFLSYYRSDNTSIPGYTGWGPRVKANQFGDGMGMGAMPWEIGLEIPELYDINEDAGGPPPDANDFVCVQLLNNDGTPLRPGPISGVTNLGIVTLADADVQPDGSIRLGGWDYLGSGNILILGESRQSDDLALTGQASGRVPAYRIVTPGGLQVKAYSAVSATPEGGNVSRNGTAVTANGFAVRWQRDGGGATVRLFDNSGTPTTTNLDVATLTGHAEAGGGGGGGDWGISGNGQDAYVLVGDYNNDGLTNGVWVTVLNADGTVRWSRDVADDLVLTMGSVKGASAAMDKSGQVVVVFSASPDSLLSPMIMGRRFDAAGNPAGATFYVSEVEPPDYQVIFYTSDSPNVAWRDGKLAVAWVTRNNPDPSLLGSEVIANRFFVTDPPSLSITRSGSNVTISWSSDYAGFNLESSSSLTAGSIWGPVSGVVNNSVTLANPTGTQFYRLKK